MPSRSVTALTRLQNRQRLTLQHHLDGGREQLESDVVIFATGYRAAPPAFLAPLSHRLHRMPTKLFTSTTISPLNGTARRATACLP